MKKLAKYFLVCLIIISQTGCKRLDIKGFLFKNGMQQDVETRFEFSMYINNMNGDIAVNLPSKNYKFYFGTDMHIKETTNNLTKFLNIARNDDDAAFIMLCGDFVDGDGAFKVVYDALAFDNVSQKNNIPVLPTMGNHDMFWGQWYDYAEYFGSSVYTFKVNFPEGSDLYIVLDSANGTIGKSQLKWLRNILKTSKNYRYCVVFSHTNIFRTDINEVAGNIPLEETYELISLFTDNGVTAYVAGHVHTYGYDTFYNVAYITGVAMIDKEPNAGYLLFNAGDYFTVDRKWLNK